MTAQQLYTQISGDMDDLGLTFFQAQDIQEAVQNAYDLLVTLTGCIQTTVRFQTVPGHPYYDISLLEPRYYCTSEAFNISSNRYLVFRTPAQLLNIRDDYELWPGQPIYISNVDSKRIGLFPVPTGEMTIALKIRFLADVLSPASVLAIPPYATTPLRDLAISELLEQAEEVMKAANATNNFSSNYNNTKTLANGRGMPNMVVAFRGVDISAIKGAVNGF